MAKQLAKGDPNWRRMKRKTKPAGESEEKSVTAEKPKRLSGLDAAYSVLSQAGCPMTVKAMIEVAKEWGTWPLKGKTPEATIRSAINREIKAKGDDSRFVREAPGIYTARAK